MKKRIGRRRFLSILRALSQLLFFLLLPGLFIGAFDGVRQLVTSAVRRSFDLPRLLPQMAEAVAVVPLTLAAGRFFCGWMCSFGALQDLLSAVSLKLLRRKFFVPERADRALKSLKYLLLAALIAVPAAGWSFFSPANPWSAFAALFEFGKLPSLPQAARGLLPGFLLLFGILLGSFFLPRFFCRYLCPLGAVLSLVSLPRITVVRKPRKNCEKCRLCARECPMGIPLGRKDAVRSGECIACFRCQSACPRGNAVLAVSDTEIRPALAGLLAVAAMAGIYCAGTAGVRLIDAGSANTVSSSAAAFSSASSSEKPAGTSSP